MATIELIKTLIGASLCRTNAVYYNLYRYNYRILANSSPLSIKKEKSFTNSSAKHKLMTFRHDSMADHRTYMNLPITVLDNSGNY